MTASQEQTPELTTEQRLLMFVDSGEKRRLTLTEGGVMRLGIRQMAERIEQASRTVGGLNNRIRELEQKLAAADKDVLAGNPFQVECTHCGAQPGQRCRATNGVVAPRTPHTARLDAVRKEAQ